MSYQTLPVQIAGGSNQNRSRPASVERTVNMYAEVTTGGRSEVVLHSFPGNKIVYSGTTGACRGLYNWNGVLYGVTGGTLYSWTSTYTRTTIGSIGGAGRCIFSR
jgi:hypothetical protein